MKPQTKTPTLKVILSAGGTGGHIFPALAVAMQLKQSYPNVEILFVGAKNKMEMEKIPQAGFDIVGLDIVGFNRTHWWKNLFLPYKLLKSLVSSYRIIKQFKPNLVMGFGGYASFTVVRMAQFLKIPTAIHEQNSIVGKSNLRLSKRADLVFVAYRGMEKYFYKHKIIFSGNPLRQVIKQTHTIYKNDALLHFGFTHTTKKTILVIGGSLGSKSINQAIFVNLDFFRQNELQLIWQCGKDYAHYATIKKMSHDNIVIHEFVAQMDFAYAAADIIISRAGALSVAELSTIGKPVIFIPYPYAAEDHQTKNAQALVQTNAALMVDDKDVQQQLFPLLKKMLVDEDGLKELKNQILSHSVLNADIKIVENILLLMKKKALVLDRIQSIYFIGIGGAGMTNLVKYCLSKKMKVYGYDKTKSDDTIYLESLGVKIMYDESLHKLPMYLDCVIYTPAIPIHSPLLNFFMSKDYPLIKRSQFLGLITKNGFNICIAGTHGKTSVSAMTAHLLYHNGGCNAYVGGTMLNYNTNYLEHKTSAINVIEADEFDKSFLQLTPHLIVVTALDADHLEVYGTKQNMVSHYFKFLNQLSSSGCVFLPYSLYQAYDFSAYNCVTYSIDNEAANVCAKNIVIKNGILNYDVFVNTKNVLQITMNNMGVYNIENSLASIAIANILEIPNHHIESTLKQFKGVKRRFQYVVNTPRIVYIDDYAHHPEEIRACVDSVRKLFPQKKITAIFQPHLFTRTRDYANDFARALEQVDRIVVLPIYPARENPIHGITSEWLLQKINHNKKCVLNKTKIIPYLQANAKDIELVITIGAGDIGMVVSQIKTLLTSQQFLSA